MTPDEQQADAYRRYAAELAGRSLPPSAPRPDGFSCPLCGGAVGITHSRPPCPDLRRRRYACLTCPPGPKTSFWTKEVRDTVH